MSNMQQNTGTSAAGRPLCRYFASNICFKGDQCEFSHESNARPDMTCRFYHLGSCSYGKACRYDHVRPKNDAISGNTATEMNKNKASVNKVSIPKTNNKFSANSKPFVPAPIPEHNPWQNNASSSLNNFHQNFGLELELICGPEDVSCSSSASVPGQMPVSEVQLCPYFEVGLCEVDNCPFVHGSPCDMCGLNVLHPHNEEKRKAHHRECLSDHEKEMEAAFAGAKSADMQCGICMETIVEKGLRFGILQNCSHCYCLDCIRKWRQQDRQLETKIVRSCPECRVHSNYVIPSKTWIDDKVEKEKLIKIFHENTKKIQCKYIKGSNDVDKCPFGNKCFYKHQLPDGTSMEGKSPNTLRKERRHRFDLYDYIIFSDEDSDFEY